MARAFWSPEAERDLEDVAYYIALKDARPATAERIVREVQELCEVIATQPQMGEGRPELGVNCRAVSFKRWIILYRPSVDGIDVLRFIDGARDFGALF